MRGKHEARRCMQPIERVLCQHLRHAVNGCLCQHCRSTVSCVQPRPTALLIAARDALPKPTMRSIMGRGTVCMLRRARAGIRSTNFAARIRMVLQLIEAPVKCSLTEAILTVRATEPRPGCQPLYSISLDAITDRLFPSGSRHRRSRCVEHSTRGIFPWKCGRKTKPQVLMAPKIQVPRRASLQLFARHKVSAPRVQNNGRQKVPATSTANGYAFHQ
jgi:hypothetical protein